MGRPRLAGEPVDEPLIELRRCRTRARSPARLDGLAELVIAGSAAPALVTAAVVHGELLALRPFGSYNGLVARAAERIVLIGSGLDPKSICPAEVGHAELGRAAYLAALDGYVVRDAGGHGRLDRPLRAGGRTGRAGVDGGVRGAAARGGLSPVGTDGSCGARNRVAAVRGSVPPLACPPGYQASSIYCPSGRELCPSPGAAGP